MSAMSKQRSDRSKRPTHSDAERHPREFRRVWFIGAGFSTAMGYPPGRGLVADLVVYLDNRIKQLAHSLPPKVFKGFNSSIAKRNHAATRREIVERLKAFAKRYLARSTNDLHNVDVAEFFTIAQALAEQGLFVTDSDPTQSGEKDGTNAFARLYYDLTAVLRSYFIDICDAVDRCPKDVEAVLDGIDPDNDAIVNFNWDEEVDCYLSTKRDHNKDREEYDVAYTLHSWQERRFLILKPHGSIGWYDVAQGIGNRQQYFIADQFDTRIPRFEKRLVAFFEFELPREIDDPKTVWPLSCPPIITPPTFGKRFPYAEQRLIWQDVISVCRHAREFVFLGYSLPPDDYLTRAALRCSLDERSKPGRKTRSNQVRCLSVTRFNDGGETPPGHLVSQLEGVFGKVARSHFLNWTFGQPTKGASNLFSQIEDHLREATV